MNGVRRCVVLIYTPAGPSGLLGYELINQSINLRSVVHFGRSSHMIKIEIPNVNLNLKLNLRMSTRDLNVA